MSFKQLTFILPFSILIFSGCYSNYPLHQAPTTCKYPKLKLYNTKEKIVLTVKKVEDKICVKEWKACLPEQEFYKLYKYIKTLKTNLQKCNYEIKLYNKQFANQ